MYIKENELKNIYVYVFWAPFLNAAFRTLFNVVDQRLPVDSVVEHVIFVFLA